jgi:hypothetical protein
MSAVLRLNFQVMIYQHRRFSVSDSKQLYLTFEIHTL